MTTEEQIVFMQFLKKNGLIRRYKRAVESHLREMNSDKADITPPIEMFNEHMAMLPFKDAIIAAFLWVTEKGYEDKEGCKFWYDVHSKWLKVKNEHKI